MKVIEKLKLVKKKSRDRHIKNLHQGLGKDGKPNVTNNLKYTEKQFSRAIKDCYGVKYTVYKRIGCASKTLDEYLTLYPALKEQFQEEIENAGSFVDGRMFKLINQDNTQMITLYQKTKGGYAEKNIIDHQSSDKSMSPGRKLTKNEMKKFKDVFTEDF